MVLCACDSLRPELWGRQERGPVHPVFLSLTAIPGLRSGSGLLLNVPDLSCVPARGVPAPEEGG